MCKAVSYNNLMMFLEGNSKLTKLSNAHILLFGYSANNGLEESSNMANGCPVLHVQSAKIFITAQKHTFWGKKPQNTLVLNSMQILHRKILCLPLTMMAIQAAGDPPPS